MAQVVAVARDGVRVLVWTRTALKDDVGTVQYGRILHLGRLLVWPELYLDTLLAHGQWEALDDPVPADDLLARATPAPLQSGP